MPEGCGTSGSGESADIAALAEVMPCDPASIMAAMTGPETPFFLSAIRSSVESLYWAGEALIFAITASSPRPAETSATTLSLLSVSARAATVATHAARHSPATKIPLFISSPLKSRHPHAGPGNRSAQCLPDEFVDDLRVGLALHGLHRLAD